MTKIYQILTDEQLKELHEAARRIAHNIVVITVYIVLIIHYIIPEIVTAMSTYSFTVPTLTK